MNIKKLEDNRRVEVRWKKSEGRTERETREKGETRMEGKKKLRIEGKRHGRKGTSRIERE